MRRSSVLPLGVLGVILPFCAGCGGGKRATTPSAAPERTTATVTADDIKRTTGDDQQIEKSLAGRVAGVVVTTAPDGSVAVRIRGGSSAYGNNAPLYVVDGMQIEAGPNGALTGINPDDIESIRVLKDAAETSMYGSRGANGVIVIKLKGAKRRPPPGDYPA